jgi:two-component system, response regulator YesN
MNIVEKLHLRTLYSRLVASNVVLITLLTAFISIALFNFFSSSAIRQINILSEKSTAQSRNMVESIMEQNKQLAKQLFFNNEIIVQINAMEADSFLEAKIRTLLNSNIFVNSNLYSIVLYNGNTRKMLTTDFPNIEAETIEWLKKKDVSNFYQIVPRKIVLGNGTSKNVYTIFAYDRFTGKRDILNAIILNINEEAVQKSIYVDELPDMQIIDKNGVLISNWQNGDFLADYSQKGYVRKIIKGTDKNFTDVLDGKKTLVSYSYSEKLGWYFINLIPYEEATADITNTGKLVLTVCLIALVLGFFATSIISGRISLPFSAIAKKIQTFDGQVSTGKKQSLNESEILSEFYANMSKKIGNLEDIKENSLLRFKWDYLKELLQGNTTERSDDAAEIKLHIDISGSSTICVVLIRPDNIVDLRNIDTDIIQEEIGKKILQATMGISLKVLSEVYPCEAVEIEKDIAVLLSTDNECSFDGKLTELLGTIQEILKESLQVSVTIAIGSCVQDYLKIYDSYRYAYETCYYRMVYGEGSILVYETILSQIKQNFQYPYNIEKSLLESIRLGKEEQIALSLDSFFSCLGSYKYDFIMLSINHLLLSVFVTTEMSFNSEKGRISDTFSKALVKLRQMETLEQIKRWFANYIAFSVQKNNENRKKSNAGMKNELSRFMEMNFTNPDLSVEWTADKFNYNAIYFGKLFKDTFEKSFLEYLTDLRFDKALQYLNEGKLTIKDISTKVGFNNSSYFMTCFKKRMGISPNEYRQKLLSDK